MSASLSEPPAATAPRIVVPGARRCELGDGWSQSAWIQDLSAIRASPEPDPETVASRSVVPLAPPKPPATLSPPSAEPRSDGGDLLTTASHEIRTPMYGLLGMLDMALRTDLNPTQQHYLTLARASAASLATLVNDLLDLSKLQSGHFSVTSAKCDLHRLLDESLGIFSVRAAARNIEFSLVCATDLAQWVEIDATRLLQVLSNLVGNAIKFTAAGRVSVDVSTQNIGGHDHLRVAVCDTGPGIAPADLGRIFQPFAQFHGSTSGAIPNTGLGLTITRSIISAMGGQASVSSELGKGSCFEAVMPVALLSPQPALAPVNATVCLSVADEVERKQYSQWLAEMGCECVGLDRIHSADLVVCDVFHPVAMVSSLPMVQLIPASSVDTLRLESKPGSTRIQLHKPLTPWKLHDALIELQCGQAGSPRVQHPEASLWKGLAGARVLLIDDDAVSALVSQGMLTMIDMRVTTASDGREAIEALMNAEFDIVLTDLRLPGMDGYDIARWVRDFEHERSPSCRSVVIALSASTAPQERQRCFDVGMDDFVAKPVLREQLYAVLQRHTERRGPLSPAHFFVNTTYDLDA
jgi:CheY-like chemotaxis protein/anti-sigma regulatory factor (Ser/Thr protein kinase)